MNARSGSLRRGFVNMSTGVLLAWDPAGVDDLFFDEFPAVVVMNVNVSR
jgi:hypothetical protein